MLGERVTSSSNMKAYTCKPNMSRWKHRIGALCLRLASAAAANGNGCPASGTAVDMPNSIVIRGPGSYNDGFCYLAGTESSPEVDLLGNYWRDDRDSAVRAVRIIVEPTTYANPQVRKAQVCSAKPHRLSS